MPTAARFTSLLSLSGMLAFAIPASAAGRSDTMMQRRANAEPAVMSKTMGAARERLAPTIERSARGLKHEYRLAEGRAHVAGALADVSEAQLGTSLIGVRAKELFEVFWNDATHESLEAQKRRDGNIAKLPKPPAGTHIRLIARKVIEEFGPEADSIAKEMNFKTAQEVKTSGDVYASVAAHNEAFPERFKKERAEAERAYASALFRHRATTALVSAIGKASKQARPQAQ